MKFFIAVILGIFSITYYILNRPYDKTHTGIILDKEINDITIVTRKRKRDTETVYYLGKEYTFLIKWDEGFNGIVNVDEETYNYYDVNNSIELNYDIYRSRNISYLLITIGIGIIVIAIHWILKLSKLLDKIDKINN